MKKSILFLAAAASLVACSKNEVTPVSSAEDVEISYNVAPKVKTETTPTFDRDWTFKSTAFYLQKAKAWKDDASSSTQYIDNVDISWDDTTTPNVWRNTTKKYYWPKDGKLTFFAWTSLKQGDNVTGSYDDNKKVVTPTENQTVSYLTSGVTVDATNGVKIANYDVTAAANKNYDLLVADIKANQVANNEEATSPKYNTNGVPTLFKHKLSQVFFTAVTVDSNKNPYDYKTTDGIEFTLNSITFKGLDQTNTYTQGITESSCDGSWGTASASTNQVYTNTATALSNTVSVLIANGNQYYYLPQDFTPQTSTGSLTSDAFVVNYTVKYANGTTETIDKEFVLNDNATGATAMFAKWEMGKRYTINLKFSLNEILWDPAVQDWETANRDVTVGE
jgi:hypothetical protein